ncbi:Acyl carrier protein phosphodiesterase [Flavobacterium glycines]|uniref:ACP phosphodiesterase n=2 Tax=Flavobacterium glycines TaxID=551990 RepID=A0A1B9DZ86_9FLAO|nr:ACP phosphodiesterase [Flavobacterium glycines]OCB74977.1 ACP phosphodiesterase [Flavobacterium glycines]SDJ44312.1 Acyl carrier protein phosphodiesterase [Flavobacterium glycines]
MNFLAHIYLSGNNEFIKIGNFMADGIRGRKFEDYHPEIQKGILLHRAIDTFTDAHPIFRESTKRLHERYHHYAGVIVDIFYDHFLAKNWTNYSDEDLEEYISRFYQSMHKHHDLLSERAKGILPYMEKQNWLSSYQSIDGIHEILSRMDRRTDNNSNMRFASEELKEYYSEFEQEFSSFFEDIKAYCSSKLNTL